MESVLKTVCDRIGNFVYPTKRINSTAQSLLYKNAGKTKTAKSPKWLKPSSPTDYNKFSVRKLKHDVKIKEEFIDKVDISKGLLAPFFGSTSVTAKDATTTTRGANRQNDEALPHRQSH